MNVTAALKFIYPILRLRQVIIEVLTCILAFSISFPRGFSAYTLGVWFGMCILLSLGHWRKNVKIALKDKSTWTLFALLALFILGLISLSYADNTHYVMKRLFNGRFPLTCIPLAIILANVRVPLARILKCYCFGAAAFVVWCFIASTYTLSINSLLDIYQGIDGSPITLLFYDILNRSYSNTNVALALISMVYLVSTGNILRRHYVFYGVVVVLLVGFLIINTSRMVVFSLLLVGVVALFMQIYRNRRYFYCGLILLVCMCLTLILTENRFSTTIRHLWNNPKEETLMSETPRFTIWKAALEIDKHNYLWGYGDGNVDDALVHHYEEIGFSQGAQARYMCHNQYLELYLELGIPGVLVLLVALFLLWKYVPKKYRRFSILASMLLMMVMLTECFFTRTAGATTFAFFFCLICTARNTEPLLVIPSKVESKRKWFEGICYVITVAAVMFFSVVFHSRANATYLLGHYRKFMAEDQSKNPPVYQLDANTNSVYYNESHTTATFFKFFLARNYQYRTLFSVDCFVSSDYSGTTASILDEAQDKQAIATAFYDMSKKGSWQQLSLNLPVGYNAVLISAAKVNVESLKNMKGYVLFSNPKWSEIK